MTEPIKVIPSDSDYGRVYSKWLKEDKPAIVHVSTSEQWMKLETDGMITFLKLATTDSDNFNSVSIGNVR